MLVELAPVEGVSTEGCSEPYQWVAPTKTLMAPGMGHQPWCSDDRTAARKVVESKWITATATSEFGQHPTRLESWDRYHGTVKVPSPPSRSDY